MSWGNSFLILFIQCSETSCTQMGMFFSKFWNFSSLILLKILPIASICHFSLSYLYQNVRLYSFSEFPTFSSFPFLNLCRSSLHLIFQPCNLFFRWPVPSVRLLPQTFIAWMSSWTLTYFILAFIHQFYLLFRKMEEQIHSKDKHTFCQGASASRLQLQNLCLMSCWAGIVDRELSRGLGLPQKQVLLNRASAMPVGKFPTWSYHGCRFCCLHCRKTENMGIGTATNTKLEPGSLGRAEREEL